MKVYRIHPDAASVPALLNESAWQSRVWSGAAYRPCVDCTGDGRIMLDPDGNPAEERCGTCRGRGEVEDVRRGVSACRDLDDLYRYFGKRMGPDTLTAERLEGTVLVELEADPADDDDHDSRDGLSILVWPRRIISVEPFGADKIPAGYVPTPELEW